MKDSEAPGGAHDARGSSGVLATSTPSRWWCPGTGPEAAKRSAPGRFAVGSFASSGKSTGWQVTERWRR